MLFDMFEQMQISSMIYDTTYIYVDYKLWMIITVFQYHCHVFCPQAVGDSAQGFLNFLLFCVLQERVRQYMWNAIMQCLRCKCTKKNYYSDDFNDSLTPSGTTPSQMSNYSSDPPRYWVED